MKRIIIAVIFTVSAFGLSAQTGNCEKTDSLAKELHKINSVNARQNQRIKDLTVQLQKVTSALDSLQKEIQANNNAISETGQTLDAKVSKTEENANQRISAVDRSLDKKSLYGIIGVLAALLLSALLSVLLYWTLHKKQKKDKLSIEENLVTEFLKQAAIMDTLSKALQGIKIPAPDAEPDHSLALKLADEITLMERNISLMDKNVKGLKQLARSIGKLKDNLAANGYEIPELLGKPFNEGMKVIIINSIPDENLKADEEIITKIIKPQVNYNDKMIQAAQIEVSIGV